MSKPKKKCPKCELTALRELAPEEAMAVAGTVGNATAEARKTLRSPQIRGHRASVAAARAVLRKHGWCSPCRSIRVVEMSSAKGMLREELRGIAAWPDYPGLGRSAAERILVQVKLAIDRGEGDGGAAAYLGGAIVGTIGKGDHTKVQKLWAAEKLYSELAACVSGKVAAT